MRPRPIAALVRHLDVPASNPAFPTSYSHAAAEIRRMQAAPAPLARPVVVLAGYRAWSFMPRGVAANLCSLTGAPASQFHPISYPWRTDIPAIAAEVCRRVESRWPSPSADESIELDVVGVSMGGLVARAAAAAPMMRDRRVKPLRIARLFTLASPHRGAKLATIAAPDAAALAMRPGSEFLKLLDDDLARARYQLICYSRLRDTWVGARRASPEGHPVHWVSGPRFLSHITVTQDPRLIADIARRLRGESPLAIEPATPPPTD